MRKRVKMKIREHFEKGGKLERFYPLYEMAVGLLMIPPLPTKKGAHIRDHYDVKRMMVSVIFAGTPAFIFGIYNAGYQHFASIGVEASLLECFIEGSWLVLPVFVVVYAVGSFWEMLFAIVRKEDIAEGFLVTGFLIPCIVPPTIPLWQVAVATSFGIVIGKEVFGGTGMNVFNPALVTRAFLFFAYPGSISGDRVWTSLGDKVVDGYTMATPLSVASAGPETGIVQALSEHGYTFWNMFIGLIPGSIAETSALMILLGAIFLLVNGVADWRIMLSVFAGGYVMALIFNLIAPSSSHFFALPAHYHLVMGGFAFGAVFMATDPVSASDTRIGKYIYGFMIGLLAILVRAVNPAYPEGMMLSILFMNAFAPLIDNVVVWRNIQRRLKRASE